jgi:sigma-E factor negative regulatory protein RseB
MTPVAAGRRWLPAVLLGMAWPACAAPAEGDALAWLSRADKAARAISYAGTFVHTNGDHTSTLRITHVNVNGEEHERIEPLDGPPLEIIRRDEEMICYYPDAKTVRLDRRISARFFPAMFRGTPESLLENYSATLGRDEQVLGFECKWVHLEPRQAGTRFAQRLCVEKGTGLVLRAKAVDPAGQVIEQQTFTDLRMGQQVARSDAKSLFQARVKRWTTDSQPREESRPVDSGFEATPPAGFRKLAEVRRTFPGRPDPVTQLFYTDGLASVSVFVEPIPTPPKGAVARQEGTTAVVVNPAPKGFPQALVTVVGELPVEAAKGVASSVRNTR